MIDRPKYRILVVDDDREFLESHASFVEALGYGVETASDGIEALEKLPLDIDFVLLDAKMPVMDGFEVAERIRSDPRDPAIRLNKARSARLDVCLRPPA